MFCPRCGAQNTEEAKFCRACGTDISLVPQAVTGVLAERLAAKDESFHGRRRQRREREREDRPATIERAVKSFFLGVAFLFVSFAVFSWAPAGRIWWFWIFNPRFQHVSHRRRALPAPRRREEEARRAALLHAAADGSPARAARRRASAAQHGRDDLAAERHGRHDAPPRRARRARARRRVERAPAKPSMSPESKARVCVPVCVPDAGE